MKGQSSAVQQAKASVPIKQVKMESFFDRIHDAYNTIAKRAYEMFDHDGKKDGCDVEHWLRAESELFHPMHFMMKNSDHTLRIRAEVPGFTAGDLEVSVEPRRLAITGKRKIEEERTKGTSVYFEQCSDQIFRVVDLPVDVDPNRTTAKLKDGILELEIPKATSKGTNDGVKTA
jgi:HSP20 family protein